jgi:LacI family transcriptional regulator
MNIKPNKVTRNDVARYAGVSPSTVSYVLNDGPRSVSTHTREKVLKAIRDLGYHPNAVARNLRSQKTTTIGLIIPDTCNTYFAEVAEGIESVAFERNYTVVFCNSDYKVERELVYANHLVSDQVAGVIILPASNNHDAIKLLSDNNIPTISLDRYLTGENLPSIVADNFRGGYIATKYLIELGHTRIGCVSRPVSLSHTQDRVNGYLQALSEANLKHDDDLFARGGYRMENGKKAMEYLLALEKPPTAVFCYNDMMAIGALRAAYEKGLHVPQDISIIGFDDIIESAYTCPALTTVRQDKFEMGRYGMKILFNMIEEDSTGFKLNEIQPLDVELIVRESTAPAPDIKK